MAKEAQPCSPCPRDIHIIRTRTRAPCIPQCCSTCDRARLASAGMVQRASGREQVEQRLVWASAAEDLMRLRVCERGAREPGAGMAGARVRMGRLTIFGCPLPCCAETACAEHVCEVRVGDVRGNRTLSGQACESRRQISAAAPADRLTTIAAAHKCCQTAPAWPRYASKEGLPTPVSGLKPSFPGGCREGSGHERF